jgi:4-hydroxyphenylpyruvate dioxygenase
MRDFCPIKRMDHLEFYVGNARQAAVFYAARYGFTNTAYRGLETGCRETASYLMEQGDIRFVLTSPLRPDHPIARHIQRHGDGVGVIALEVPDVRAAFQETTQRGAAAAMEPTEAQDASGLFRQASIHLYGDTLLLFVERGDYRGTFAPGFQSTGKSSSQRDTAGLLAIDHIVGNVELGAMDKWVRVLADTMGFTELAHFDDKTIVTEYSALMSKVMQDGTGRIKFPINEPAKAKRRSQIDEFLQFYGGPGVQHIAMATDNIIDTVEAMRKNDVSFLRVPQSYYDMLPERVGTIKEDIDVLADLGILVDRDDEGYMLQIFTKPVADRPTLFFEVIQRRGSRSFGKGNFKALFEAIEREQAVRGTL